MRIAGPAIDRIVGLVVRQAGRDIGLAQDDRARFLQTPDRRGVLRRPIVARELQPERGRQSGDVEALLHGHRHAGQRQVGAQGHGQVDLAGLGARAVEVAHDHRVDRPVQRLDPGDRGVGQLQRADGSGADGLGERRRARARRCGKFMHGGDPFG